jgi:hypothetical protein
MILISNIRQEVQDTNKTKIHLPADFSLVPYIYIISYFQASAHLGACVGGCDGALCCELVLVVLAGVRGAYSGCCGGARPRVLVHGLLAGVRGGGRGVRPCVLALVV